jgi:hypothetical protein
MQTIHQLFDLPIGNKRLDRIFSSAERWIELDIGENGIPTRVCYFARHPKYTACTATLEVHLTIVSQGDGITKSAGTYTRTITDDGKTPIREIARLARFLTRVCVEERRRGGPIPTPDRDKIKIVEGWLEAQGTILQDRYASTEGITAKTLRAWEKELEERGKI